MMKAITLLVVLLWATSAYAIAVGSISSRVAGRDVNRATVAVANVSGGNALWCAVGDDATTASTQVNPNTTTTFTTTEEVYCISPLGTTATITEVMQVNTPITAQVTCITAGTIQLFTAEQTLGSTRILFVNEGGALTQVCPITPCTDADGLLLPAVIGSQIEVFTTDKTTWFCAVPTGTNVISAIIN